MRRAGLLIAGVFLATGAGLALSAPASAAVNGGWCDDYGHGYYHGDYHYYHHGGYYHRYHHGGSVWIGIGVHGD